ncbi:DUF3243 domain-containing protein [Clostridium sp.]|uniref:DUF3243 domain-containing protein n=1 Tax=Clostridium sp. TaxID=1506 RepID=UPI001A4B86BA|nr:DUF3243 domain-containing protein [Clostridium sp.]MBK5234736.1 DUF3243 domain-containing protein [Clostridium sp.]
MDLENNLINDWDKWKKTLYRAVSMGETVGLSDDTITKLGSKIGDYLASNVDPDNREQRLLKELFEASGKIEKETLTRVIIKMIEKDR